MTRGRALVLLAVVGALGLPAAFPVEPAWAVVVEPTPGPAGARVDLSVRIAPNPSATPTTPPPTTTAPPDPPDPDPGGGSGGQPPLARTGAAVAMVALVGGLLVVGGVVLRVLARRRADAERWLARRS